MGTIPRKDVPNKPTADRVGTSSLVILRDADCSRLTIWKGELQNHHPIRSGYLSSNTGNYDEAHRTIHDCLGRPISIEERARVLRLRSRIHWMQGSFDDALNDSLAALHILGIDVPKAPTKRDQDIMFEQVKDEILEIGFDEILGIPRATDPRTDLAVAVLNDAGVSRLVASHYFHLWWTRNQRLLGGRILRHHWAHSEYSRAIIR